MDEPYYLRNFRTVLEDVGSRHADLLRPREADLLGAFGALGPGARMLYVRLLTRRGPWVRRDGLAYPEIGDPGPALDELRAAGFAATEEAALPGDLAPLLRRPEIEARLREAGIPFPRKAGRDDLEALLLERSPGSARVPAVSALERAWADLMLLLFFGNGEQGLADFVVADLGHVRYEAYPLDPADRAFRTRDEVDALRGLGELRESLEAGGDLGPPTEALLAMEACPGIRGERRWRRLLAEVGRAWERKGEPERALACFKRGGVPPCRERTARIHLAQGRISEAAEAALAMAEAPLDTAEASAARRILARLARKEPRAAAWLEAHPP
ncbi:MAG TPA: hypothetical protein VK188_16415, partial [Holophaga sp.]|nr:hypothetical protein [Holophaga sp.]